MYFNGEEPRKMFSKEANNNINFMTLQRPTFEEMERRRMIRENMSPQRSTTLQRRESMISRGFNAIMRRQSFMGSPSKPANNLKRNDSFFMHSALLTGNRDDPGPSLILSNEGTNEHPLHTITRPSRPNLGRAKSFKYPEKVSQIPPAELTRLRSKSQVRPDPYYNSAGSSDDPVYTSGSGGSAAGSAKNMLRRNPTFNMGPSRYDRNREELYNRNRNEFSGSNKYFEPPPRVLPRRPSPRDISEPPPGSGSKRRLPLPDIFFYGDRWQEQETKTRPMPMASTNSSLETPEPPPGSSDIGNHQNTR